MAETYFTFFGVRGSYPVADESVKKYGGNTTSLLIEHQNDIIIFDAGTGIIKLGEYLKNEKGSIKDINIFITHYHLDHLMGMSFFYPFSDKSYRIKIYYPEIKDLDTHKVLYSMFEPPYSPIGKEGIQAKIELIPLKLKDQKSIEINQELKIESFYDPLHPIHGVMLYKVNNNGKSLVFATDIEPDEKYTNRLKDFIKGSNVLIHDSQYLDEDYYNKEMPTKGYGHSTFTMAVNNAIDGDVDHLYLFHHNPFYSDNKLDKILKGIRKKFKNSYLAQEHKKNIL